MNMTRLIHLPLRARPLSWSVLALLFALASNTFAEAARSQSAPGTIKAPHVQGGQTPAESGDPQAQSDPKVTRPSGEMGSKEERASLLKQLRRSCERFSKSPRLLGERRLVCRCLHDEHSRSTGLRDLRELVRIYRESHQTENLSKGSGGDVDLLIQYDMEIADECLARLKAGQLKSSP